MADSLLSRGLLPLEHPTRAHHSISIKIFNNGESYQSFSAIFHFKNYKEKTINKSHKFTNLSSFFFFAFLFKSCLLLFRTRDDSVDNSPTSFCHLHEFSGVFYIMTLLKSQLATQFNIHLCQNKAIRISINHKNY